MAFEWSGYIKLADELARRSDEASHRSAISRAYYYVYHLALKRARDNEFAFRPGEAKHAQLWRLFSANPDPACKKLAQIAVRLKEKRERADYEPVYSRIQDETFVLLADAREFAASLSKLSPRLPDPKSQRQ